MSERRQVEGQIHRCGMTIEAVASELANARSDLETHRFLVDANPGLLGTLGDAVNALDLLGGALQRTEVRS